MRRTFSAILLFLALAAAAPAAPSLSASADRAEIYLHDSFQLTLRIEGADREPGAAVFDATSDAAYEHLGSSSDSRTFVQIVNGRTTRRETFARVLTYRVTPREAGLFQIRRISLPWDGTTLTAPGPSVQVTGATPQDLLDIALEASRDQVLVDEPFEMRLAVTVRPLAEPHRSRDPFPANPPPRLELPFLAQPVPKGLRGPEANELLQPRLVNARNAFGFAINDLTVRNDPFANPFDMPFDVFGQPTTARFRLDREEVEWNGAPAWRYRLAVRYTPEREGAYHFGPVSFKGHVIAGLRAGGVPSLQNVFAAGPERTVHVVPPPEEGRPPSFLGSVGTGLNVAARLDTQTCRQGDPLTLMLDVTGAISLSNLRLPRLSLLPEIAERFRTYDDAVRTEPLPDGRRFLLTLRPLQAGTIELPPLPFSYYDTRERAYRTVWTDPLPLRVEAVEQFDPGWIIDTVPAPLGDPATIRVRPARTIPAAITVTPAGALPDPPHLSLRQALLLLPGPLLAGAAALLRWTWRHRRAWRRTRRRRNAARRAAMRIRRAKTLPTLLQAAALFFEERFDLPAAGFAPLDAAECLRAAQVPQETARPLLVLLQALYDDSFRPVPSDPDLPRQARRELPVLLKRCSADPTPSKP